MRQIFSIVICTLKELKRKKDFYVLFILMSVFLTFMASQNFFGVQKVTRYVIDLGYSFCVFFSVVIAVSISARQLPSEMSSKTIYPLISKPISRQMVIAGKFFGSLVASVMSFSLFFLVFLYFYISSGVPGSYLLVLQCYFMGILLMCMVCSLSVFFSNFLTLSANITVTMLIYILTANFSGYARSAYIFSRGVMSFLNGFIYYIIPHFEFYDLRVRIVHSWEPLPAGLFGSITLYTIFYCSAFLALSGAAFKRRAL